MKITTYLLTIFFSVNAFASDGISDSIIHFDEPPFKSASAYCEEEEIVIPSRNDFEIVEYALMSSKQGDRYALLTIKNTSSGGRRMRKDHLVAVLANCKRVFPLDFEISFKGREIITREINFGLYRFPIIEVISK